MARLGIVFGEEADDGIGKGGAGLAIENIAFDGLAIFQFDGDVAAVVEGFFERFGEFGVGDGFEDFALEEFVVEARYDF